MPTITLEVPDELATQFKVDPAALPALLQAAVTARTAATLDQEIITFLTAGPPLEEIIGFKLSTAAQQRLEELLDKQREEGLTPEEQAELERYLQHRHVMILLKAGARRVLSTRSA